MALASELGARFVELTLGRDQVRFRGSERVQLVLRLQAGDELARLDLLAHRHRPLQEPAADPEAQRHLVGGGDPAGEHDRLGDLARLDLDGPDRPHLRHGSLGLGLASGERAGEEEAPEQARSEGDFERHRRSSDPPRREKGTSPPYERVGRSRNRPGCDPRAQGGRSPGRAGAPGATGRPLVTNPPPRGRTPARGNRQ